MCPSNLLTPNGARDKQSLYEDITKKIMYKILFMSQQLQIWQQCQSQVITKKFNACIL